MIFLPRAVRVYFATEPVSLRRSFDGLSNEVRAVLRHDPLSGHVFVFLNRRRDRATLCISGVEARQGECLVFAVLLQIHWASFDDFPHSLLDAPIV